MVLVSVAVVVAKAPYCCDPEILLPWLRDVTLLLSTTRVSYHQLMRLSKRQSLSTTVLFRTTLTQNIIFHLFMGVPNKFSWIGDSPYLKAGIQDFQAKWGWDSVSKVCGIMKITIRNAELRKNLGRDDWINPEYPTIKMWILICYSFSFHLEKLIKYQANSSYVIMSVILMTTLFYKALIFY